MTTGSPLPRFSTTSPTTLTYCRPTSGNSWIWHLAKFPVLHKFLLFWERELEGKLHSVKVANVGIIQPTELKHGSEVQEFIKRALPGLPGFLWIRVVNRPILPFTGLQFSMLAMNSSM